MDRVVLKPGKEKSLKRRHPWIFSGAIASCPKIEPGTILPIYSSDLEFLGVGYFHSEQSLCGRVLAWDETPLSHLLKQKIEAALTLRTSLLDLSHTNCYRLIHSEADGIPGLIVDVYGDVLSIQINTYGIERLKELLISLLVEVLQPKAIFEKSLSSARKTEGLEERQGFIYGSALDEQIIQENGIFFKISLSKGQKTGFFLDQREMRALIGKKSYGKKVLNCFSYSGGFSLYALKGGATHVVSVDCSEEASLLNQANTTLNALTHHEIVTADVFDYLKKDLSSFDVIILDPPAFAKKRGDIDPACRGYKEINRLCFSKMKKGSLLLTCSCSYFIDSALFQNIIFQAALEAGRDVKIIGTHQLASDHPIALTHPESSYLKSLFLYVS